MVALGEPGGGLRFEIATCVLSIGDLYTLYDKRNDYSGRVFLGGTERV